jgi:hypothetical protein
MLLSFYDHIEMSRSKSRRFFHRLAARRLIEEACHFGIAREILVRAKVHRNNKKLQSQSLHETIKILQVVHKSSIAASHEHCLSKNISVVW